VSFYTPVIMDPKVPGTIFLTAEHIWSPPWLTAPGRRRLTRKVTAPDGRGATTTKAVSVTPAGAGSGGGRQRGAGFRLIRLATPVVHLERNRRFQFRLACPVENTLGCVGSVRVTAKIGKRTPQASASRRCRSPAATPSS
jgi:hypothetical protein